MEFFNYSSISTKLKIVILSTTLLAVVFVYAGFFTYERVTFRKITVDDLETKADIIAENINAALVFQDSADAARVLRSLHSQHRIISAAVYDQNGVLFTTYTREGEIEIFPRKPESKAIRYEENALILYRPVLVNDHQIGMLYMRMDLLRQTERFWSYIQIAFFVLLGSLAVAYAMATVLERNISRPIMNLASTIQEVSKRQDYSLRTSRTTDDETGFLADAFNLMLTQIQERDTTLQNSEERYRTTLDNLQEGCQIISFDYRYLYLNDVSAKQGRNLKADLLGNTMMEKYPGIEKSHFFTLLRECLENHVSHKMENEFVYPDGTVGWFALNIEPVPEGAFILSADITKEKQQEIELVNYREHLEELVNNRTVQFEAANKELEAFSYSVSHDLRAPLRHIDGFAQLLKKKYYDLLNDQGQRYVDNISGAAKEMGQLIDELLVFSRMGREDLQTNAVNMDKTVQSIIEELTPGTEHRNITIQKNALPIVRGDQSMLRLVWMNLLSNAFKYSNKIENALIRIKCQTIDKEFIFSVNDNGAGFDMKYVDKLFGVFQRLHRSDDFEGIGIGLANVHRIIMRHHGRVWAEGEVGKGATFYFSLPV